MFFNKRKQRKTGKMEKSYKKILEKNEKNIVILPCENTIELSHEFMLHIIQNQ